MVTLAGSDQQTFDFPGVIYIARVARTLGGQHEHRLRDGCESLETHQEQRVAVIFVGHTKQWLRDI